MIRVARPGTVCLVLRLRVVALGLALTLAGCTSWFTAESIPSDVAGEWKGSMDGQFGRGAATLIVQPTGRYEGALHLTDGDRPFTGTIMTLGSLGGRYAGTDGNGTVTLRQEDGRTVLKFVRDGGGSTATFVRLP